MKKGNMKQGQERVQKCYIINRLTEACRKKNNKYKWGNTGHISRKSLLSRILKEYLDHPRKDTKMKKQFK